MKIVLVGARGRNSDRDRDVAEQFIELCSVHYPGCIFVSAFTHQGVGMFVREKCREVDERQQHRYELLEVLVRCYASSMLPADFAAVCNAQNATLVELADVIIYLASVDRRGSLEDLLVRAKAMGLPILVHLPGDPVSLESL